MDSQFDLYLYGHEHTLSYVNYPYAQTETDSQILLDPFKPRLEEFECLNNIEMHFSEDKINHETYKKGEAIH